MVEEMQKAKSPNLSALNKLRLRDYRSSANLIKDIYDYAKDILDTTLGSDYTLPIDIERVAEKLGFTVSEEDLSETKEKYFQSGHDCIPISQTKLRKRFGSKNSDQITGIIHTWNQLSDSSKRVSIAHQLGCIALRNQKKIGMNLNLEAWAGSYPMASTEDILADIFAYALLLPYHLYMEERKIYESYRSSWPLDYSQWISFIKDRAQMPEYCTVIACHRINEVHICTKVVEAKKRLYEKLKGLGIQTEEDIELSLELYRITINNLEELGCSTQLIAQMLFGNAKLPNGDKQNLATDFTEIIEYLNDVNLDKQVEHSTNGYPINLLKDIRNRIKTHMVISEEGIDHITSSIQDEKSLSFKPIESSKIDN